MSNVKVLKHNCIMCKNNEYLFKPKSNQHPDSNCEIIEKIECTQCGYPISAIEFAESEAGIRYDEILQRRTLN